MCPSQEVVVALVLFVLVQVQSQQTFLRKFTNKYHFPGVTTGRESMYLKIAAFNLTTPYPYVTLNMSRTTYLETNEVSCRHFPLRFAPYNFRTFEVVDGDTRLPVDYFVKGRDMIVVSDFSFDGAVQVSSTGFRSFLMAKQGLDVYFLETSLGTKQFIAFTSFYPFRATKLFFGVHHNNRVGVSLRFDLPDGYNVITASAGEEILETTCRISDIAAVIMPGSVQIRRNAGNLRIVADTLYNKSFDASYLDFAAQATQVHIQVKVIYPTTFNGLMTLAVVPFLNTRPAIYGHRMCMFDAAVASSEPHNYRYYLTLCMIHQHMTDHWTGGEAVFYYMFEGLREYMALKTLDKHDKLAGNTRVMKYYVRILNGDDNDLTATVITRRDLEYISKPNIIYKTVIFLRMLEAAFLKADNFMKKILRVFERDQLMTTDTFCKLFENNLDEMSYPNNTLLFCDFYDRWTTSVGYPILMGFVEPGKLRFIITNSNHSNSEEPYMFPFRFVLVFEKGAPSTTTAWLLSNVVPLQVDTNIKPIKYYYTNPNATGLYRTNYDIENWRQLLKYAKELNYHTKITMIADSFYFYTSLNLHFHICLSSLLLLKDDTEHVAWESVDYVLTELDLLFRDSDLYDWFLSFLGQLVHKYYRRYTPKAPVAVRFACKAGVRLCLEETWRQLQEFVTYRHILVGREAVLCAGMRSASRHYYVFLECLVAKKERDRHLLLMAMTCFEDQPLLERLLAKIFLRNEFRLSVDLKYRLYVHMIMATREGGQAAWKFFLLHHRQLKREFEGQLMDHLLDTFAKCLVSRHHVRMMRAVLVALRVSRKRSDGLIKVMLYRNRLLKVTYDHLKDILGFN